MHMIWLLQASCMGFAPVADPVPHLQVEFCESLEAAVGAFKLEGCWTWKHLLNGKQVSCVCVVKLVWAPSTSAS